MRTIIVFLIAFFCAGNVSQAQQNSRAVLEQRLDRYMGFSKYLQIDSILNYIYPRLYEIAPKSAVKKVYEQELLGNDEISIAIDSLEVLNLDSVTAFSKGRFATFRYTSTMKMLFVEKIDSATFAFLDGTYRKMFGAQHVHPIGDSGFLIRNYENAVAINDNYTRGKWMFLSVKEKQSAVLAKILPLEVRRKLNMN